MNASVARDRRLRVPVRAIAWAGPVAFALASVAGSVGAAADSLPDGRIRIGNGPYAGDDIHNTTGKKQTRRGPRADVTRFDVLIENDGSGRPRFNVLGTDTEGRPAFTVRYTAGGSNVTDEVVAGTYQTPRLPGGTRHRIRVKVTMDPFEPVGSHYTGKVTIAGASDDAKDVVKFRVGDTQGCGC